MSSINSSNNVINIIRLTVNMILQNWNNSRIANNEDTKDLINKIQPDNEFLIELCETDSYIYHRVKLILISLF